jgi:DNA-binding transcriptional ArsR family regulator
LETYIIKRLEQARLLSDPFKLKVLGGFSNAPATTKQVADRMGEKAPRLYRHVEALFEEGLLELVEEKPKRGTVERYYKTIAGRFEVDPGLFSPSSETSIDAAEMMRSLFRDTESDILRLLESHKGEVPAKEKLPLLMKVAVRASADEIQALRAKLEEWVAECETLAAATDYSEPGESYSALLTFYPSDPEDKSD